MNLKERFEKIKKIKKTYFSLKDYIIESSILFFIFNMSTFFYIMNNMVITEGMSVHEGHIFFSIIYIVLSTFLSPMMLDSLTNRKTKRLLKENNVFGLYGVFKTSKLKEVQNIIEELPESDKSLLNTLTSSSYEFKEDKDYINIIIDKDLEEKKDSYTIKDITSDLKELNDICDKNTKENLFLKMLMCLLKTIKKDDLFSNKDKIMNLSKDFSIDNKSAVIDKISTKLDQFNTVEDKEKELEKKINRVMKINNKENIKKEKFLIKNI
jgi:hypothetical protein